jgi:hypothetical protein
MAVSGTEEASRLDKQLPIPTIPSLIKRATFHRLQHRFHVIAHYEYWQAG